MLERKKIAAILAEFLGTATLALVVINVTRSAVGIPYFVAFAGGLAVILMGVSIATEVQLNPALTLGLWTARRLDTFKAVTYIVAQLLGGWAAYGLYKYFVHGAAQPAPAKYEVHVLVAESVGTFVFALAAARVFFSEVANWSRAAVVGGAYTLGMIVASVASSGFLNPAVALGANQWVWKTYVLGPVLGAVLGINLYSLLFAEKATTKAKSKK